MSDEVYVRIRAEFDPADWPGKAQIPTVETLALIPVEELPILKAHIRSHYTHGFAFHSDEYDNMNLRIVSEEHHPAKVEALYNFLGEKLVIGDDLIEPLYDELEQ